MKVVVVAGTDKGAFFLRSDDARRDWRIEGPEFKGWKATAFGRDGAGNYLMGTTSFVYGAAIHKSNDLKQWRQVERGPEYPKGGERKLTQIWKLTAHNGTWYAGVAEAGLFRSTDAGESWHPMPGLNEHRTRSAWCPGAGGLCAHAILVDPKKPQRMWCGISAVGVFRSEDGGDTWHPKNHGVPIILEDKDFADIGFCVHALASDPGNADRIWRQDHKGMFRTSDGGDTWERIENGLPSGFGFPLVVDRSTRTLFAVPLESDEYRFPKDGRMCVYRSRNGGDSWEPLSAGLPQQNAYAAVMRAALDVDQLAPCGVYMGTTAGDVYVSIDSGESWRALPCRLPRIHCLSAFQED